MAARLTDDQIRDARRMWAQGMTLNAIAEALSCGVYDLSPWLYQDATGRSPEDNDGVQ